MSKKVVSMLLVCALALAAAPLWAAQTAAAAGGAAADAGEAAVAYSNALALANTSRAWNLLSAGSRQGLTEAQWQGSFERRQAAARPSANSILPALASSGQPPVVAGVLVHGEESLVSVTGSVQVTQTVVLVKEAAGWRVDLTATDQVNAQEAARSFLDAVREQMNAGAPQARRAAESSLAALRLLLRPEARNFRVLRTEGAGDRLTVTVGTDLPVHLVLRENRSGAGWTVDLTRPLAPVDILSPDPLKEAVAAGERQACEDQLRQVASGIRMYASSSDDMLPDPKRWQTQIAPLLPQPSTLHCPADPTAGVSYAFNSNLAGKRNRDIGDPSQVPMVFESSAHKPNAADAGASWPATAWHSGGVMVLYADGSVRLTPAKPSFAVPPAPPGGAPRPGVRMPPRPGAPGAMGGPGLVRPVPPGAR
jgi:prepilin-type processing-associated H-X9-DG protein